MKHKSFYILGAVVLLLSLVLGACAQQPVATTEAPAAPTEAPPPTEVPPTEAPPPTEVPAATEAPVPSYEGMKV